MQCRKKDTCPLEGVCLTISLVYKALVHTPENDPNVCVGMTEHELKSRFNGYTLSIKHRKHANSTAFLLYIQKDRVRNQMVH